MPATKADVRRVRVIVPSFMPLVGDALSQLAVGVLTDHLSTELPAFVTLTVLLARLVPA
jgi:hypothetical protein